MKTFCVQTLGCKVNHYESEQIAGLLTSRGLRPAPAAEADLRIVNSCSVTTEAAAQSRQTARRLVRLTVAGVTPHVEGITAEPASPQQARVIVTGCWATSDRAAAAALPGVSAVLTHHDDVAAELDRLLERWMREDATSPPLDHAPQGHEPSPPVRQTASENLIRVNSTAGDLGQLSKATPSDEVNHNPNFSPTISPHRGTLRSAGPGATSLPMLGGRQASHVRAFLKVQDGCDAHCTYCIIPQLRPKPWTKPLIDTMEEARRLTDAGHPEIVLTGIFLGAYGQSTALRRRQQASPNLSLAKLIESLCTQVPNLKRLRLSSLEPGDLTPNLIAVLKSHAQVAPHFHLPLQSGSDALLRRMNRQYGRDDYLRMLEMVNESFDRPALTTDIIVGFPGETEARFERTLEVVQAARFIHIHAFPYSPRPGTAAARWERGPTGDGVRRRIEQLQAMAGEFSYAYRRQFIGETVEVLIERPAKNETGNMRHGRCERYFNVSLPQKSLAPGEMVNSEVIEVDASETRAIPVNPDDLPFI